MSDEIDEVTATDRVRRWEDAGGVWRVLSRHSDGRTTVSLCRCDGGEEVDRLSSADSALIAYLAGRDASDD